MANPTRAAARTTPPAPVAAGDLDTILRRLDPAEAVVVRNWLDPAWRAERREAGVRELAAQFYDGLSASRRAQARAIADDLARATTWQSTGPKSAHHVAIAEIVRLYDGRPPGFELIRKCLE